MPDQADQLRQLVRRAIQARPILGPGLPIIVLSGGMSGVGTTTLAIQLARELAQLGKAVALVDADLAQPQLAERLDLDPHGSLADVLEGSRSAVEVLQSVGDRIHVLPAQSNASMQPDLSPVAVGRLMAELRGLGTLAEVVIIDAGHGMSPWVQRWWRAAQHVFLITTEQEAAVKGSYLALKLAPWGDADGKVRLVVNRCDDRHEAEGITQRFARTCRRFLGLHVEVAPAVACLDEMQRFGGAANVPFRHSVRLLATEVVSSTLVVSGRMANRGYKRGLRVADLLAHTEKSPNLTNNPQTELHK
jgi:flagellar biosynthesis protein FlhG